MDGFIGKIIGILAGKKDAIGSRKWLALLVPCALHFSGQPVPREAWATAIAYIFGQSFVDAKKP